MSNTTRTPTVLRNAVKAAIGTSVAGTIALAGMPAMAQTQQATIQQLKAQMERIQDRLNELEAQNRQLRMQKMQQQETEMAEAEPGRDKPGFMVGNTRIQIGGYLKFDAVYNLDGEDGATLGAYDAVGPGGGDGGDSQLGFTAKESRLSISTTTATPIGDVGGYFELDLYGGSFAFDSDYEPRFRLAYLTYGNWLFGKAWSTFSDFNYGYMLNFFYMTSQIFERQAQIRYTFDLANGDSLALAVEAPDGDTYAGTATDTQTTIPDFVARYQGSAGNLSYQVAAVGLALEAEGPSGNNDTAFGFGLDVGGSYSLSTGTTLMLQANYGQGNAKYTYEIFGSPSAYFENGDIETIARYGYIATLSQDFNDQWSGNLIWSQNFSEDTKDEIGPDSHDEASTVAVNLLYSPVDPLTFGVEYSRFYFENEGGADDAADRVQFSTVYRF